MRHLGEVVVLGGDPERRHRLAPGALEALGDQRGPGHLGQGVERAAEESRLLAGDDDQRVGIGEALRQLARARVAVRRVGALELGRDLGALTRPRLEHAAARPARRRRAARAARGAGPRRSRRRAPRGSDRSEMECARRWRKARSRRAERCEAAERVASYVVWERAGSTCSAARQASCARTMHGRRLCTLPSAIVNQRPQIAIEWIDVPAGSFRHGRRSARRGEPGAPGRRRRLPSRARSGDARRVSALSRRHRARGAAVLGRAAIRGAAPARGRPVVGRRDGVLRLAARRRRRRRRSTDRGGVGARRQGRSRRGRIPGASRGRRSVPDYERRWLDGPEIVDLYPSPHPWGFLGLGENVHEWCADWFDADYYLVSPAVDPRGPDEGKRRASRGGSWRHDVKVTRCAARSSIPPRMRYADYGFRLRLRRWRQRY